MVNCTQIIQAVEPSHVGPDYKAEYSGLFSKWGKEKTPSSPTLKHPCAGKPSSLHPHLSSSKKKNGQVPLPDLKRNNGSQLFTASLVHTGTSVHTQNRWGQIALSE